MAYCHCLDHNHGHNCLTTTNTQLLCIIMGLTLLSARHLDMYFFLLLFFLLTLRVWQDNCNYPHFLSTHHVTDLQGPPSERTQSDKIRDLKSLAKQYARDQGSCDDTRISYLEYVESEAEADWTLARMIAG
jgi:hypothetical protein